MAGSKDLLKTLPSASVTSETHVEEVINVIISSNNGCIFTQQCSCLAHAHTVFLWFFVQHHN